MPAPARWLRTLALGLTLAMAWAAGARAEDESRFNGGLGLAATSYATTDSLRAAQHRGLSDSQGQPIADGRQIDLNRGNLHAFLDWYPWPTWGFGLQYHRASGTRRIALDAAQSATLFGQNTQGTTYREELDLTTLFLTANWLAARGSSTGLGLTAGLGPATYRYFQSVGDRGSGTPRCGTDGIGGVGMRCDGRDGWDGRDGHNDTWSSNRYHNVSSVQTVAGLAGVYFDWGRPFGIRLGLDYVVTPSATLRAPQPAGPKNDFSVDASGWLVYLDARFGP